MKTNDLLDIIGEANDEFIHDAKANQKPKTVRFPNWAKWSSAIAACLVLVVSIFSIFPYENWTDHQAEDPNWHKTHFETANLSEIEAVCGTNLLLDRISMPGEYHSEYILEISEGGLFDNTDDWNNLTVQLSNGKSKHDHTSSSVDYILCFISFNGNTDAIDTELWDTVSSPMEMNGFMVRYSEKTTDEYAAEGVTLGNKQNYHGYAIFENAGYTYYLSTHSDDPDFFDETLKNKLIYGATHDPNADNSEHAITGPGKPLDSNE